MENQEEVDVLSIDNTAVRQKQIERIERTKQNRNEAQAQACLEKLIGSAKLTTSSGPGKHPLNLLKLAIDAARARCTVGEISHALESVWNRHVPKVCIAL